ncbi:hypothetical protein MTBBW1_2550006 [Desulfamplus magnetovallimortis]|uniref:Uncharacterized protein n=1 Tax=Desulfamplus magnetovallimortis TaxID=1246637 RepID=A0A1W1HEZ7_9BACT|nr:hypothetical protein [Desulfamplus magnetovallimortis]SLM30952.1 hypothetical protein MTBBW1_2550006 [Desulfamplus magnetovallimortis]
MNQDCYTHSTRDDGDDYFIHDQWKRKYHFKISRFLVPTGMAYEAIEVKEDDSTGYRFNSLYDLGDDQEVAMEEFIKKIKKGLNQRHLKKRGSKWEIGGRDILRGRIEWSEDFPDTAYGKVFIIDGKRITIEQFAEMLEPFEGWGFQFKIVDLFD